MNLIKDYQIFSPLKQNIRLDQFLASHINDISRSKIKNIIINEGVSLNGIIINNPSSSIESGTYVVKSQSVDTSHIMPANIPLDIIYEDDDLLVINKQAGLTVHPGAGNHHDTLVNALINYYGKNLSTINGEDKAGIVHRLDRDTTGLMVVAKNDFAHMKLSEQLQDRTLSRQYYALCYGSPENTTGRIETYIDRSRADRTKMKVTKSSGKLAITDYALVETCAENAISLIRCKLHTGRTHQIRVHLMHIGLPLIGDQTYGKQPMGFAKKVTSGVFDQINSFPRQALHSYEIKFLHPRTGLTQDFAVPYPVDIQKLISEMNS